MVMAQQKSGYESNIVNNNYSREYNSQASMKNRRNSSRRKTANRVVSITLLVLIMSVFGLIGAKTVHTTVVKKAEIRLLERELENLAIENDLLQVEVDKLRSIGRIEKAALAMGMEKPEGTIYVASNLITPENSKGVENTQPDPVVPQEREKADSMIASVTKIFTSFFASTQR